MCLGYICNHPHGQENYTQKYVNKTVLAVRMVADVTKTRKEVTGGGGPQSEGRGFVHCGQRGFFRCRRPHFFCVKNFGFFEIYGVRTDRGGGRV